MKKFTLVQKLRNKIKVKGKLILCISKSAKIVNCVIISKGINNQLLIGDETTARHVTIEIVGNNCSIDIGQNCILGEGSYLSAKEGKHILVGDECMFSRNAKIMTSDGHPIFQNNVLVNQAKDIRIENNVWLADNVTILKGVHIGKNSVVGINSTVTKNIVSSTIVAGNPAKEVKNMITWSQ